MHGFLPLIALLAGWAGEFGDAVRVQYVAGIAGTNSVEAVLRRVVRSALMGLNGQFRVDGSGRNVS
jgi:hypothetical protein